MALVSTCFDDRIKITVSRAHQESTPSQTWSKLLKISEGLKFDIKPWKMLFCEDFDLIWPSVNPRLTRGIFVILAEKDTLSTSVSKRVAPHHYICSCDPMERKWYFWVFQGLARKSKANKIRYQHSLLSLVMRKVKPLKLIQIVIENCIMRLGEIMEESLQVPLR